MPDLSSHAPAQPSIDDQLLRIVKLARAAGFDDGAEWIQRQATETLDRIIADFDEPVQKEAEHSPISYTAPDALVPDSFRTDAAKGFGSGCSHCVSAIAFAASRGVAGIDHSSVPSSCRCIRNLCRCHQLEMERILATLTDAERESARYKDELAAATKRERALEGRAADAEEQAAKAKLHVELIRIEWRESAALLKACIEEERERANDLEFARDLLRESNATLTRKLTMAKGIARSLIGALDGRVEPMSIGKEWLNDQRTALAAIDAPAGEEAKETSITRGAAWNPDAPPPEPVNAQGSGAALDHICLGAPCPYCVGDTRPFTVEEARQRVNEHELNARGYRGLEGRT